MREDRGDVEQPEAGSYLAGTRIEVLLDRAPVTRPRFALFDFDGTLSLVREGWPDVMIPLFVHELQKTGTGESVESLTDLVKRFVAELTGKQTIFQMMRLVSEIEARGGHPLDPLEYKQMYHDRLMDRIRSRRDRLASGAADPDEYRVPGSLQILNELRKRGVALYLASGTDENFVREEAELLGLSEYFGEHIHGAQDDYRQFSKKQVIERLISEHSIDGSELVGFGDGYVEIENIREAGGLAVAVASNEAARDGSVDPWKRQRLLEVGAHLLVPDFQEADRLCRWIWGD